jgi:predicted phosphoribosyltransferase
VFYPSRQALGDQLAMRLTQYKNNESIIFCLKKSSLLSCIELAAHLHAYIYVLQYAEIADPFDITRNLGAITPKGEFVLNPDISQSEYEYIASDFMSIIEERKREAFSEINGERDPNPYFDLAAFNNRNVLLFADVLQTSFQIQVALNILKAYTPTVITGVVGNITSAVSDKFLIDTDGVTYMDVLQNNFFEDSHYFDQPDNYSEDDKINMANNISLYWA